MLHLTHLLHLNFVNLNQDEGISHVFLINIQPMHIYSKEAVFQVHEAPKS